MYKKAIVEAFNQSWNRLITEINGEEDFVRHLNESVFRYFFVSKLRAQLKNATCEDEWHKVDLLVKGKLVKGKESHAAIEFKFYDCRPLNWLSGETTYKGSVSKKNLGEFVNSLEILANLDKPDFFKTQKDPLAGEAKGRDKIKEKYFVLVGVDRVLEGSKSNMKFSEYYGKDAAIEKKYPLRLLGQVKQKEIGNLKIFGWICAVNENS